MFAALLLSLAPQPCPAQPQDPASVEGQVRESIPVGIPRWSREVVLDGSRLEVRPPDLETELKVLRRFLFHRVYRHHRVCRMAEKAKRFLRGLFTEYLRYSKSLPPEFQAWGQEVGIERAVCDYIAGMTDRFALKEYERLFAPFEIT